MQRGGLLIDLFSELGCIPAYTSTDGMNVSSDWLDSPSIAFQGEGQHEEGKEKIAMTSPVTAEMGDDEYKVQPRGCTPCSAGMCKRDLQEWYCTSARAVASATLALPLRDACAGFMETVSVHAIRARVTACPAAGGVRHAQQVHGAEHSQAQERQGGDQACGGAHPGCAVLQVAGGITFALPKHCCCFS